MARPLRIEFPGAVYHVTSRGNARSDIYENDEDRAVYLAILTKVTQRYNWLCHAYCLMDNHYHLVIETPDGNLSAGMRHLNGVYTQAYNRSHRCVGHLFQGRFKSILIEKESHLLELSRYIVLNPVRANMVDHPDQYQWSSYLPTLGKRSKPDCLTTEWLLGNFSEQLETARGIYRQFVKEGIDKEGSPWEQLVGTILLGSEDFTSWVKSQLKDQEIISEIPRNQRHLGRPTLDMIFNSGSLSKEERNIRIHNAHIDYGYSLKEIATKLEIHYTTVSKVINRGKK